MQVRKVETEAILWDRAIVLGYFRRMILDVVGDGAVRNHSWLQQSAIADHVFTDLPVAGTYIVPAIAIQYSAKLQNWFHPALKMLKWLRGQQIADRQNGKKRNWGDNTHPGWP